MTPSFPLKQKWGTKKYLFNDKGIDFKFGLKKSVFFLVNNDVCLFNYDYFHMFIGSITRHYL